ncbi:hypothetical protein M405DRAFT_835698, partial [Rhizopogon salebrosus TDB-379]
GSANAGQPLCRLLGTTSQHQDARICTIPRDRSRVSFVSIVFRRPYDSGINSSARS